MRMKKMLILALLALFYIGASVMIPPQQVVVDDDVGVCYVAPVDQSADVVAYVADNDYLFRPDSGAPLLLDVEKSSYVINPYSPVEVQCIDFYQNITAINLPVKSNNTVERRHRLDIGETLSQDRVISRHA